MKAELRKNHRDIARSFSTSVEGYEQQATLQRGVAAKLVPMIGDISPQTIFDLGCGTGALTALLLARWPAASITAIDAAPGMIEAIKQNVPHARAYVADIACLMRDPVFDLVASSCALHWVSPFADGIARVAEQVRPGGTAALSVMLDGTLRELHEARREAAPDKTAAGRMPTFDEVGAALRTSGFEITTSKEEEIVQVAESPRAVLASLREQGLTGGHLSRGAKPLTRGELKRVEDIYLARFSTGDGRGVKMTYRVGYFVAAKPK